MKIRSQKFLRLLICGLTVTAMSFAPQPSHAQQVKKLNKKNITEFIEKTTDIASGNSLENVEEIQEFLTIHLHEKARFKSSMKFNIPGFPTQETALTLNKEDFIEHARQGASALSDYQNEITIKSIKISKDKRKATVQTISQESGMMDIDDGTGNAQQVPVEGSSSCQQIIMLNNKNYIQMYQANCKTEIFFQGDF